MRRVRQLLLLSLLAACGRDEPPAPAAPPALQDSQDSQEHAAPVYAPNNVSGVGSDVIDVEPSQEPYQVGPNPPRAPR